MTKRELAQTEKLRYEATSAICALLQRASEKIAYTKSMDGLVFTLRRAVQQLEKADVQLQKKWNKI